MEDINHCKRCGKNLSTKNRHSISFMFYTVTPEMYYVCDSCYNKILRYVLTRPVRKGD